MKQSDTLERMRRGAQLSRREEIALVLRLSVPAILSQISTIIMEYIDASMVGSLGASASAAIGIVATTTWLIGGLCAAIGVGFTVGIAHRIGAGEDKQARDYVKAGFLTVLLFAFALMLINIMMCFLDVVFNAYFIYPARTVVLPGGLSFWAPGAGLGVMGAAIGTLCAEAVSAIGILLAIWVFSKKLHFRRGEGFGLPFRAWRRAIRVSLPVMVTSVITGASYMAATLIVAPLGTVAVASHSFAITAEGLGYMPGFGIAHAATALVGQARGAGRPELEKRFGYLTVLTGMIVMALSGLLIYLFAPQMIGIMSPDPRIRALGTQILRIEAFAEPLYGASIVAEGVFRGLGRTGIPSALNLFCMWCVRLPVAALIAGRYGLPGVWTVMCGELCLRGFLYLVMMRREFRRR